MSEIDSTLNERGARYGNYSDVAGTTNSSWLSLNVAQTTSI